MSEVVVKLTDRHIKVKGGEYVQDIVRCKECRHWTYGKDLCTLHDMGMMADDYCSYGEKNNE